MGAIPPAEVVAEDSESVRTSVVERERWRYPWRDWADGRWRRLIPGEHFASRRSVEAAARGWAARHGRVVETRTDLRPARNPAGVLVDKPLLIRFLPADLPGGPGTSPDVSQGPETAE